MTFNSIQYFALLLIVVLVTRLVGNRVSLRNLVLLVASYAFYAAWDARFLVLLLFSTGVDYLCGLELGRLPAARQRERRWILALSIACNLGLLATFKYLGWFVDSARTLLALDAGTHHWFDVTLPIGISFYTFQTLGYTIDVYKRRIAPERDAIAFGTFVAFFPQLVAGPIERASRFLPQLRRTSTWTWGQWNNGWQLIALGMFKKLVLADNAGIVVDAVFAAPHAGAQSVYLGAFAFIAQLYFDVSAYTDIARGSAKLLGFELSKNFDGPFLSVSPLEFWARWHMTASSWFRDYLYRPLAQRWRTTWLALLVAMVATGLWHGASWNFVLFGLFHGIWILLTVAVDRKIRLRAPWKFSLTIGRALRWCVFIHILAMSGILFRAPDIHRAWTMYATLWTLSDVAQAPVGIGLIIGSVVIFLAALLSQVGERISVGLWWAATAMPVRAGIYLVAILAFVMWGRFEGERFIYYQF